MGYGSHINDNHDIINIIHKQLQLLSSNGIRNIFFYWIKGHSNNICNDHVDSHSKSASAHASPHSSVTTPLHSIPSPPLAHRYHTRIPSLDELINVFPSHIGPLNRLRILRSSAHLLSSFSQQRKI